MIVICTFTVLFCGWICSAFGCCSGETGTEEEKLKIPPPASEDIGMSTISGVEANDRPRGPTVADYYNSIM